jgi:hypothetical protein
MANDRVYAVCLGCGAWKTLVKFYPGDLRFTDLLIDTAARQRLEWMDRHAEHCHPHFYGNSLEGNPGFRLTTENEQLPYDLQNAEPPECQVTA